MTAADTAVPVRPAVRVTVRADNGRLRAKPARRRRLNMLSRGPSRPSLRCRNMQGSCLRVLTRAAYRPLNKRRLSQLNTLPRGVPAATGTLFKPATKTAHPAAETDTCTGSPSHRRNKPASCDDRFSVPVWDVSDPVTEIVTPASHRAINFDTQPVWASNSQRNHPKTK